VLTPGYVLGAGDGEHLVHFRDGGDICIKLSGATGSNDLALVTQQVKVGSGIPTHRHLAIDEAFSVLKGRGTVTLDDVEYSFEAGASIFIPRMTWHGFANPEQELLLLWIVSPPGLEDFFRATCSPPGAPPKGLTSDQIREVARKHGTEFR
jgi:mannose-6-phosphate isomerase-like protein (cupin superfamily)